MFFKKLLCIVNIMIKVVREGSYKLVETKGQIKILTLDGKSVFAWINLKNIGEILVASHNPHKTDHILALGRYRMYKVKDEPKLVDLNHLELFVGNGKWQGYLLPTGLPENKKKRSRIMPTRETITASR